MTLGAMMDILLVRRRRTFVLVFACVMAVVALITFLIPKRYDATATLFVGENRPVATGANSVPLDEVLAQSYRSLLGTPAIRAAAARRLRFHPSPDELAGKLSFDIEPGTHLITITATDASPQQARTIANTYASTFVQVTGQAAAGGSQGRLAALRRQIGALAVETQRLQGQPGASKLARLVAAQNELAAARAAYATIAANTAFEGTNVALASPAALPGSPSRPKPKLYLAVGAFLALLLGMVAAFVREALDERVNDGEEISKIFEAPVLAYVPDLGGLHRLPEQAVKEAFEFLRTNLELLRHSHGSIQTLAVTGPVLGSGKTFVVSELAKAIAASDESVLALDADLRRPALGARLGLNASEGLTEALMSASTPEEFIYTAEGGAQVLPAGRRTPPNPSLLLSSPRAEQVLAELRTTADHVLIDTPPVLAAPETSMIGTLADGVLMVLDARNARRKSLVAAREQLDKAGARIVGVVLNRVTKRSSYDLYYSYGYGRAAASNRLARNASTNGDARHAPLPVGAGAEEGRRRPQESAPRAEATVPVARTPGMPIWADPTPLDINNANLQELMLLPGIGRRPAERILALRERNGGFKSTDDLLAVEGITREKIVKIRPYIRV